MLKTIVTDFSLDGCCLLGHFQPAEFIEVSIRTVGRLPAQIKWVQRGRAGARFLTDRDHAAPCPAGRRLLADKRGVAAIEYAFLAALIAVAILSALSAIGPKVRQPLIDVANALKHALQTTFETDDG